MLHLAVLLALRTDPPVLPLPSDPVDPVVLRWEAPPVCPDGIAVAAAIAGRHPVELVQVDARVSDGGAAGLTAEIAIDTRNGSSRRRLESPVCESIVDALALLVQVAAEPLPTVARITGIPEPVAPDRAPPELPASPVASAVPRPPSPPPRRRTVRARLSAMALVGGGTLPGVDAGGRVTVGVASPWLLADLGASYLAPREASTPADVTVAVDAIAATARLCPVVPTRWPRLELSACAVATAGVIRGRAGGAAVIGAGRGRQASLRVAAGPNLAVSVHPRVWLTATVEAGGNALRAGFAIARLGQVWAPRPWAVHGALGVEVRLP